MIVAELTLTFKVGGSACVPYILDGCDRPGYL